MKRCRRFPVPEPVRDGSLLSEEAKALWARLEDCGALGEENAITCRELSKATGWSTRKVQALREELITKGHKPLGSSTGSKEKGTKGGYFILRTAEERRHCVAALRSRARVIDAEAEILDEAELPEPEPERAQAADSRPRAAGTATAGKPTAYSLQSKVCRDDQWGLFEGLELPTVGREKRTQDFLRHH